MLLYWEGTCACTRRNRTLLCQEQACARKSHTFLCRDRLVLGGITRVVDQVLCNKFLHDPELCVAALYSCAWRHTCHHSVSLRTVCGADERCDFGACLARCQRFV